MDWSLIITIVILLAVAPLLYLWKKSKGKRVEKRLAEVTYEREQTMEGNSRGGSGEGEIENNKRPQIIAIQLFKQ